ncbi:MAG: PKD domain-containing protein, partial [Saprospiraceae bacterium]
MQKLRLTLLLVLVSIFAQAQNQNFEGRIQDYSNQSSLQEKFKEFQVYQIDAAALHQYLQTDDDTEESRVALELGTDHNWDLLLLPRDLRSSDYQVRAQTKDGIEIHEPDVNKTFSGYVQGSQGGNTALTVDQNFIYGFVEKGDDVFYIEPLRYFVEGASENLFVVYEEDQVIKNDEHKCGAEHVAENAGKFQKQKEKSTKEEEDNIEKGVMMLCYDVEIALASDFSMYTKYGNSIPNVENQVLGVLNNVQTNYDDEFTHNINFVVPTQFISTCSTCDPWTNSTDPFVLLPNFRGWGNGGGFGGGIIYDVASLWSDRNFDGPTVGLAYVGVICSNSRYNVLEDFSGTAWALRVLHAHELGHNFDAVHDTGGGLIMSPSVNNSNTWSGNSINDINAHVQSRINVGCIVECASSVPPPVAGFTSNTQSGCVPLVVNFQDNSTDATSWSWTFEGGTPATSSDQNPVVTYLNAGDFDVSLEVSNASGSDVLSQPDFIVVDDIPDVSFSSSANELVVDFFNTSTNANSYFWDFGDGNSSTDENPIHVYGNDGEYVVTLEATNTCGANIFTEVITIVSSPTALFDSDLTTGCSPLSVQFANQSSPNATSWSWSFPGGNPSSSTAVDPVVVYQNPGIYDVELTVGNAAGFDTYTQLAYIEVLPDPIAGFTFVVTNDVEVQFTNTSTNADSYAWDFGDGNGSTMENPMHTYAGAGTYEVTLIASNVCDAPSFTTTIEIILSVPPVADFTADEVFGCVPHIVEFESTSTNATSWDWTFPGGAPATSTNEDPKINYNNPGTYDVTLIVTNGSGSDTITLENYITIDDVPDADFTTSINGGSVDFINTTTNGDSYAWNFGDGNTSTDENPNNVYTASGDYTVQLIATNICGSDTTDQEITVVIPPTADFSSDVTSGCADLTVNFTDQSTDATAWSWVFNGGTPATSTDQNPTVVYDTEGTYTVELTVTNASGNNTITLTDYITVNDVPNADFNTTQTGNDVDFNNNTTNGDTYAWTFGDGNTSTEENPSNTYPGDGTYTVELVATNDCGTDAYEEEITISTSPTAAFTSDITSGCADLTVAFTDQSSLNATSWSWTFEGGDPATSTDQNPTVVYDEAGTYDVTLTVTNAAGENTTTETSYISVNDVPDADFDFTINGNDVDFNNTSTNANSYAWDFGDGNSSTATNPSHTYDSDGTYTVELTATNDCGDDVITQTVIISNAPTADFSANPTSGCIDLTVSFTDESSDNAVTWEWTFEGGDPATSSAENPTVVYGSAGTYDVTLTVTNLAGEESTATETNFIVVNEGPTADFDFTTNGNDVDYNNTSTNADSYAWDFGDGNSSTSENPSHTYDMDGTYDVELTVTNDCGSDVITQTVTISNAPTADFSASPTSGCTDLTVSFTNESSDNAVTWQWTFEGGDPATSTAENPTVVYGSAGTYDVILTVTNLAGEESTTTETNFIVVNEGPIAGFTTDISGTSVSFNNTSTNGDTYSWDFGDGNTSTAANPTNVYDEDGTYTVELTTTNDCGSDVTTQTVTIVTPPVADFTANTTSGCTPLTVDFTDQSSDNTTAWSWTFEGGTPANSIMQNPSVVYDAPGVYTVTLVASNAAGNNTITQTDYIVVNTVPVGSFTSTVTGSLVTFENNSINATSYSWNFGDGNTSESTNPTHTYDGDGTYTVTLIATNNCGSVTVTGVVVISTDPVAGFSATPTTGCSPLEVSFMDDSSPNTTSWLWTFEGGTPATSTEQNPVVTFNDPGTYDVTLVATSPGGDNTFSQTDYIIVLGSPNASFTSNTTGTTTTFSNTTTGGGTYSWDFGDGNSSIDPNPVHTYDTDGTYTVILTATNDCGSTTATETVVIVTTPTAGFTADNTTGCAPLTVNFSDNSSDNTTGWLWTFTGGTPETSTDQNPTVVFDAPGTYAVTLQASNAAGTNTASETGFITVLDGPSADFTSTQTDATLEFTNTSSNADTYSWDFGDGNGSAMENPTHTYTMSGVFIVTLTATNDCGSTTATEEVTISLTAAPVANFSADVISGCSPLVVNYTDESSDNTTGWSWTFEGGMPATSTDQNPQVTYDQVGNYNVTLTVTNSAGENTITETSFINVSEAEPLSGFNSAIDDSTVDFTNTSSGATNYAWDFGDGNSSDMENPTHIYDEDGTYTVVLTVTNDCGTSEISETVVIATSPTANFSMDTNSGCGPLTVNFSDESSNNTVTWAWEFTGGTPATSSEQNPVVVYDTPGNYDVTLVVTNAQGMDTEVQTNSVVVEAAPTAAFSASGADLTIDFTNTSTSADTYSWTFGDGGTSMESDPSHTYTNGGDYDVQLIVTNDCGMDTTSMTVTIGGAAPTASFSGMPASGCTSLVVDFMDESIGASSWSWAFEGGEPATSDEQNPQVTYNTPGIYPVTLGVTNAFGSNSLTLVGYVEVLDEPTAGFTATSSMATVNLMNTSTNGTSYSWDFGDGNTSTEENPSHTYDSSGEYTITLTTTNDCGTSMTTETIMITISSTELPASVESFDLYPNPTNGSFNLEIEATPTDILRVQLFDIVGRKMMQQPFDFHTGKLSHQFDVRELASGTYVLQVLMGDEV